jgi:hypothetical protein
MVVSIHQGAYATCNSSPGLEGELNMRKFLALFLLASILLAACEFVAPAPPSRIGGRVFGVECVSPSITLFHGQTGQIELKDVGGEGRVTAFMVGTIRGDGKIEVSQAPKRNANGWSTLPGAIQIKSLAVDGPSRVVTYYINVLLGGRQGERIAGGNIWCEVNVMHLETPTPTFTSTPTPSDTPTPTPPVKESLVTCRIEMKHGETKDINVEAYDPRLTSFFIGEVFGDGQIEVSAHTDPHPRRGIVRVKSLAVDGPTRTVTYYINIIAGGSEGTAVTGRNLWCQVKVHHTAPTPTPTDTPTHIFTQTSTSTPTYTLTPKPIGGYTIPVGDGYTVTVWVPNKVTFGKDFQVAIQVTGPDGNPAPEGTKVSVSLGTDPSASKATHASGSLNKVGQVTLTLDVHWPAGSTQILWLSFQEGAPVQVTGITVTSP